MLNQACNIIKQSNLLLMAGLIIVLPFAVDDSLMFSTQSAKFFLFGFAVIVIVSLFLLGIILRNLTKPVRITPLDILLVAFFLYAGVWVLLNLDSYGLPDHFIEFIGLAALYIVFRRLDAGSFKFLFIALLLSGAAQAIYGNLQLYGVFPSHHNIFRITGGFFNPGPYSGYLAIIFPIALAIYLSITLRDKEVDPVFKNKLFRSIKISQSRILQIVSVTAVIAIVLVLPATRSRAAWLAVIVSSFLILIDRYKLWKVIKARFNTIAKKTVLIVITIILTGIAAAGLYAMKKGSADGRLLIWKVTSNMIGDKPLFGHGYDRFSAYYLNYQADYFNNGGTQKEVVVADNTTRAFNEYLQVTAEGGVIGLLFIIAIAMSVFFGKSDDQEKANDKLILPAKMSLLAFGVFALFSYPAEILPIKLCLVMCLAWIASNQESIQLKAIHSIILTKALRPVLIIVSASGLIFTISLFVPLKEKYNTSKQWKEAYFIYQMGSHETSVKQYRKIYERLKFNGKYLVNYGKAYSMAGEHEQAIKVLTRAEDFLPNTIVYTALGDSYKALDETCKAELAYLKAESILPDRFYPKYLLAKLYDETGQQIKAVQMANDLLQKDIKVNSMAVEEIKAEMKTIMDKSKMSSLP